MKVLLNNMEYDLMQSNWESLWGEWINRAALAGGAPGHVHTENTAGVYAQNATTGLMRVDAHPLRQYCWIDFDPTGDGTFMVDARQIARVTLRINAGDTAAIRVMPLEMMSYEAAA
jgi:hypothetical protein